jgi:hypothetical protein
MMEAQVKTTVLFRSIDKDSANVREGLRGEQFWHLKAK